MTAPRDTHHARLIMLKNTAYAWRQMLFFLSLGVPADCDDFVAWAEARFAGQPPSFRLQFAPVMQGLRQAARPDGGMVARQFLGWPNTRHGLPL